MVSRYRLPSFADSFNIGLRTKGVDAQGLLTPESVVEENALISAGATAIVAVNGAFPDPCASFSATTGTSTTQPLVWTAPPNGSAPFTYRVRTRLTGATAGFSTSLGDALTVLGMTVKGLIPGQQYDYEITPFNALGMGPSSVIPGVVAGGVGTAPTPTVVAPLAQTAGAASTQISPLMIYCDQVRTWGTSGDSAALQAIYDAAPAGAIVMLPAFCTLTTQVTVKRSTIGAGSGAQQENNDGNAQTVVQVNSTTLSPFMVVTTGVFLRDFHVTNISTTKPTAGSAIYLNPSNDGVSHTSAPGANGLEITHVTSHGFYDGTFILDGDVCDYEIEDCTSIGFVRAGGVIRQIAFGGDNGDGLLSGCDFMSTRTDGAPLAHLLWLGGGGLKMVGCKGNLAQLAQAYPPQFGFAAFPMAGINTTIVNHTNNSWEGWNLNGVVVSTDPINMGANSDFLTGLSFGGQLNNFIINSSEFGYFVNNTTPYRTAIRLYASGGVRFGGITIIGNTFSHCDGVMYEKIDGLVVKGNTLFQQGAVNHTMLHTESGDNSGLDVDFGTSNGPYRLWYNESATNVGVSIGTGFNKPVEVCWILTGPTYDPTALFVMQASTFINSSTIVTIEYCGFANGADATSFREVYELYCNAGTLSATLLSGFYRNAGAPATQSTCLSNTVLSLGSSYATIGAGHIAPATSLTGTFAISFSGGCITQAYRNFQ